MNLKKTNWKSLYLATRKEQIKVTGQLDSGLVEILLVGVHFDLIFIISLKKKTRIRGLVSGHVLDKPNFAFISSSVDYCTNHQATSAHADCWWQIIWGNLKARLTPWAPCNSPWVIPEQCLLCGSAHCYAGGEPLPSGRGVAVTGLGWSVHIKWHSHARQNRMIPKNTLHCNGVTAIMHSIY